MQTYPNTAGVAWEDRFIPGATPITWVYEYTGQSTIRLTDIWTVQVDAPGVGTWTLNVPMDPVAVPMRIDQLQAVVTQQH